MNPKPEEKREQPLTLSVKLSYSDAEGKTLPEAVVYAFDKGGRLLASAAAPKQEKSEVKLTLPAALLGATVRVVVGPPMRKPVEDLPEWATILARETEPGLDRVAPAMLTRREARRKSLRLSSAADSLEFTLFPPDWTAWLYCKCVVRGRLIKRYKLPDGSTQELGVCHACVKIYEVDKIPKIILNLPDPDLFRLREELVKFIRKWPPPPPPDHDFREVGPIGPGPLFMKAEKAASPMTADVSSSQADLETELAPVLLASSATQLRNALVAKTDILQYLVCGLDWLWYWFTTDFIKCTCTDEQGRFETMITYPCAGDKPDLYFKAVQCIGGSPHTVYDPGVACHTYWNYSCGSEVVLVVTDPAAIVCAPPLEVEPPAGVTRWVMPFAVGGIALPSIKSTGLTDYSGIVDAPFGSYLGFRHGWSGDIPLAGPIQPFYYRWLYKKAGAGNWSEFFEPVVRHYVKELPGKLPSFPVSVMGPKSINGKHLYLFKPHKPEDCPDFIPGGNNYWPTDTWFGDIYTGYLNTPALPGGVAASAGLYKIKLEVYDQNGDLILPGGGTFQFIVPTVQLPDGGWESRAADPGEIDGGGFVFYLRIDNRQCTAVIDAPTLGGVSAGDECGFLRYTPGDPTPVHIAFHAQHPANFATFAFSITRGATGVSTAAGEVASLAEEGYTGDGVGNFTRDFTTGALLGPCTDAAFAEVLNVDAKATNGWVRLEQYDADAVRAFALAVAKSK